MEDANGIVISQSFMILTLNEPTILEKLFQSEIFADTALEVLSKKDVSPHVLGRLSSITLTSLLTYPSLACPRCGFIYHLLSYCANPSVFNLFETICGDDSRCPPTQKWLLDMGFEMYIHREMESIDFNHKSTASNPNFDTVFEKAFCLYRLISQCSLNKILGPSFHSKSIVNVLTKNFEPEPAHLKSARWKAINSTLVRENAASMLVFIPPALQLLTENFSQLHSYRVSAIEFMTQMMIYAPLTFDMLLESNVLQSLITIVISFPNSSILHSAFTRFIEISMTNEKFAEKIVRVSTPLMVDICTQRENRVLAPFCFKLMSMFFEAGSKNATINLALREVMDTNSFVNGPLKIYNRVTTETYGGSEVITVVKSLKSLFD